VRECKRCGKLFKHYPNNQRKKDQQFCSRKCHLEVYNVEDREHGLKGAKASGALPHGRGTGEAGWYVKEGGQHQHRVIAERILGRNLEPKEIVHHEDLNKKNNHPSNLIVFKTHADHMRHHAQCLRRKNPCTCDCIRLGGDA
jgi:hypothetical protein